MKHHLSPGELFRRTNEQSAGNWEKYHHIDCCECPNTACYRDTSFGWLAPQRVADRFRNLGWAVSNDRRKDKCPDCKAENLRRIAKAIVGARDAPEPQLVDELPAPPSSIPDVQHIRVGLGDELERQGKAPEPQPPDYPALDLTSWCVGPGPQNGSDAGGLRGVNPNANRVFTCTHPVYPPPLRKGGRANPVFTRHFKDRRGAVQAACNYFVRAFGFEMWGAKAGVHYHVVEDEPLGWRWWPLHAPHDAPPPRGYRYGENSKSAQARRAAVERMTATASPQPAERQFTPPMEEPEPVAHETQLPPPLNPAVPTPDRQLTAADRRTIRAKLEDGYDEDAGHWRGDLSDDLAARQLDVPRSWVAQLREAGGYGPDVSEKSKRQTAADAAFLTRCKALEEEAMVLASKAEALARDFRRRFEAI